jgi:hypothetical protein
MHGHRAIVDLAAVAVVLPAGSHGVLTALGRSRLIDDANGLCMSVVFGHDLLAAVSQFGFFPLDRFEKAL